MRLGTLLQDNIITTRIPEGDKFSDWERTLEGLAYSALVTLCLEFLLLFAGLTAFAAGAQVGQRATHAHQ